MTDYAILETDDGMTVVSVPSGGDVEDVALEREATVVDAGPYSSYEDAYEALLALSADEEEDE